jgi:hypothetical protein
MDNTCRAISVDMWYVTQFLMVEEIWLSKVGELS